MITLDQAGSPLGASTAGVQSCRSLGLVSEKRLDDLNCSSSALQCPQHLLRQADATTRHHSQLQQLTQKLQPGAQTAGTGCTSPATAWRPAVLPQQALARDRALRARSTHCTCPSPSSATAQAVQDVRSCLRLQCQQLLEHSHPPRVAHEGHAACTRGTHLRRGVHKGQWASHTANFNSCRPKLPQLQDLRLHQLHVLAVCSQIATVLQRSEACTSCLDRQLKRHAGVQAQ